VRSTISEPTQTLHQSAGALASCVASQRVERACGIQALHDLVRPCLTAAVEAAIREWFHESSARSARGLTKLLRGARDSVSMSPSRPAICDGRKPIRSHLGEVLNEDGEHGPD